MIAGLYADETSQKTAMDSVLADINVDDGTTAITVDAEMADIIPASTDAAKSEDKKSKKLAKKEKKLMKEGKTLKNSADADLEVSMISEKSVGGEVGAASKKAKRKHTDLTTEADATVGAEEKSDKKKKKQKHKHGKE